MCDQTVMNENTKVHTHTHAFCLIKTFCLQECLSVCSNPIESTQWTTNQILSILPIISILNQTGNPVYIYWRKQKIHAHAHSHNKVYIFQFVEPIESDPSLTYKLPWKNYDEMRYNSSND